MVYRNVVLSLHELCAFPELSEAMQLWNQLMGHHYKRSNGVFAKLLGLGA